MSDVDALVAALIEGEGEQTVRDMAGHVGDQVHAVLTRNGMLMKTTGGAIAVGVMASAQVLNDTFEFARRSIGDDVEANEMAAAMRVLFEQNLADALLNTPKTDEEEAASPRCGCKPDVARRVIVDHGTCGMGGCPYGGDV